MCTVSFIPTPNGIFITSNRDETTSRKLAAPPRCYQINNQVLLFPKDGDSGGTWIAVCHNGHAGVLLNGAIEKHRQKKSYKKSRGLVFLDIMAEDDPLRAFEQYDFSQIEPFSLVLWKSGTLHVCRWNENEATVALMDANVRHLWSSCTLYSHEMQAKQNENFQQWFSQHRVEKMEEVIRFHRTALYGAEAVPAQDYQPQTTTVSITSLLIGPHNASILYCDRLRNKTFKTTLPLKERLSVYEAV